MIDKLESYTNIIKELLERKKAGHILSVREKIDELIEASPDDALIINEAEVQAYGLSFSTVPKAAKNAGNGTTQHIDAYESDSLSGKGLKYDKEGKQQWYALPLVLLKPLADVFAAGEKKYSTFNCLQPFDDADRRFWNATMRHLESCQINPLAIDDDTGCYHAAQACFNMLLRIYNAKRE